MESSLTQKLIASLENDHRLETKRIESVLDQYKRDAYGLANNFSIRAALGTRADTSANKPSFLSFSENTPQAPEANSDLTSNPRLRSLIIDIYNLAQTMGSGLLDFRVSTIDGTTSAQTEGYSWEPANKNTIERAIDKQGPVFGDAFLNPNGEARLGIAVPIMAFPLRHDAGYITDQAVSGIMTIEMQLGPVVDLVEAHEGMGETSESHIAQATPAGDAEFITLLRFKRDAAFNVTIPKMMDKPINWSLVSPDTHVVRSPDYRGKPSFLAIGTIAETGWGLVVKIDEAEAFIPLYKVTSLIWKAGLASLVLVVFSWFTLIRPLALRLHSTAVAADRLATGNYEQLIQDSSLDEIGTVSKSIDQLATDLKTDKKLRESVEKRLKFQAEHDALTGLFNRTHLHDIAERLQIGTSGVAFSVLFMDLDGFKAVNDQHGHYVGDEVLIRFARELRIILPKDGIASRWGGDEFVVILPCTEKKRAEELTKTIRNRFKKPFATTAGNILLDCSIGISESNNHLSIADCVEAADTKMYETKQARKQENAESVQSTNLIIECLKSNRIEVWYQPILLAASPRNFKLVGVEALLRIKDESGEHLLPGEFLSHIHEREIAIALDDRILSRAFEDFKNWRNDRLVDAGFCLSVNLCGATARMEALPEFLSAKLAEFKIPPDKVILELSEESKNIKNEMVAAIKKLGLKIAVDDIGLLNSNLERLASVEPDIAKFDRVWLADSYTAPKGTKKAKIAQRRKLVLEKMVALCTQLGMNCIIEGIENSEQLKMAREIGINRFQGFLFDRALSARQLSAKLELVAPNLWLNTNSHPPSQLGRSDGLDVEQRIAQNRF